MVNMPTAEDCFEASCREYEFDYLKKLRTMCVPRCHKEDKLDAIVARYNKIGIWIYAYSCFPGGVEIWYRTNKEYSEAHGGYLATSKAQGFMPEFVEDLEGGMKDA